MKPQFEIIVRAVILKRGEILLCRSKGGRHYFLPGGLVEFNEPAKKALARELKEELNISIKEMFFIGAIENIFAEDKM